MHYTGTIDQTSATGEKGKQFDSSRTRGSTFDFVIGSGQVIPGWDQGLLGLCVGAKATLVIPPALGYGEQGAGGAIPGGATLNFDVEVMGTAPAPPPPNLFKEIDANWDNLLSLPEVKAFFKGKGNPVRTQSLEHKREQCSLTEPEPISLAHSSVAADILRSRFPPLIRWYTI